MIDQSIRNVPFPHNVKAISLDFGNTLYDYYSVVYEMIEQYHTNKVEYNNFLMAYDVAFNNIDEHLAQKGLTINQSSNDYWREFYVILYDFMHAQNRELLHEFRGFYRKVGCILLF